MGKGGWRRGASLFLPGVRAEHGGARGGRDGRVDHIGAPAGGCSTAALHHDREVS